MIRDLKIFISSAIVDIIDLSKNKVGIFVDDLKNSALYYIAGKDTVYEIFNSKRPINIDGNITDPILSARTPNGSFCIHNWGQKEVGICKNLDYVNGAWVHNSTLQTNAILSVHTENGARWFASSDGTPSWNVANGKVLWDIGGTWVSALKYATNTDQGAIKAVLTGTTLHISLGAPNADDAGATVITQIQVHGG